MAVPTFITITEQVAAHLRDELLRGRWSGMMPGVNHLAPELGVNAKTVEAALQLLEKQGILVPQGAGRRRRIVLPENFAPPALRVTILPYEPAVKKIDYIIEIRHQLQEAGHVAEFAAKDLFQLKKDTRQVARLVEQTKADAWVVVAGSRVVMEWFSAQSIPTFALFGRARELPLPFAGPKKGPALIEAVGRLVALGHHRIVYLTREERRKPFPGELERTYLAELAAHGLAVGSFNLPDWEDNLASFHECLDRLFRHTPPTALIISEPVLFFAAQHRLAQKGLSIPRDVSMMCLDYDPSFDWYDPPVSRIQWDSQTVVRRVVNWANSVACGKEDRGKTWSKSVFVEGGTIGPAPRAR